MRVFKSKWASPKQIAVYVSYDAPHTQTTICFGLAYLRLEHMHCKKTLTEHIQNKWLIEVYSVFLVQNSR